MTEVIRVFLGADEYGADFDELERLGNESKRKGFHCFRNTISLRENLGEQPMPDRSVVVRGGYAGYCVAQTVDYFIELGAREIVVDLPNCRCDENDKGKESERIEKRKEDVRLGMRIRNRDDERIRFVVN